MAPSAMGATHGRRMRKRIRPRPRPTAGSEPRRWTLFCCGLLPRYGPRLDTFIGGVVEEFQLTVQYGEVIRASQLKVLNRGEARENFPAVEFSTGQCAGNNPLRTQVFDIFDLETERNGGVGHRGHGPEVLGAEADDHVAKLGEVHRW